MPNGELQKEEVRDDFLEEKVMKKETGVKNEVEVDGMSAFIFCSRFGNLHNPQAINRKGKEREQTCSNNSSLFVLSFMTHFLYTIL